jgi:hypothetical protein
MVLNAPLLLNHEFGGFLMDIKPCYFCGQLPRIKRIRQNYWNAQHHDCNGNPGVSIANCQSADQSIRAWNKWQSKMMDEFPRNAAEQSVHLTAFGVGGRAVYPLQLSLFAEVPPAIIGGR